MQQVQSNNFQLKTYLENQPQTDGEQEVRLLVQDSERNFDEDINLQEAQRKETCMKVKIYGVSLISGLGGAGLMTGGAYLMAASNPIGLGVATLGAISLSCSAFILGLGGCCRTSEVKLYQVMKENPGMTRAQAQKEVWKVEYIQTIKEKDLVSTMQKYKLTRIEAQDFMYKRFEGEINTAYENNRRDLLDD